MASLDLKRRAIQYRAAERSLERYEAKCPTTVYCALTTLLLLVTTTLHVLGIDCTRTIRDNILYPIFPLQWSFPKIGAISSLCEKQRNCLWSCLHCGSGLTRKQLRWFRSNLRILKMIREKCPNIASTVIAIFPSFLFDSYLNEQDAKPALDTGRGEEFAFGETRIG